MLKQLRKKGVAKKIIWVVAIIIIISFGFLGTAYLITDSLGMNYAGKIFGKKITIDKFENAMTGVRVQAIMQYGDNFNQIQQYLDFDSQTWDRLMLLHKAEKARIKISDEEVVAEIETYPFFKRDGRFDTLLYNDILRFVFKVRPTDFEEIVRNNLRIRKFVEEQTGEISLDEDAAFEEYAKQNEKVLVSYALAKTENFIDPADYNEDAAVQYYNNNQEEFRRQQTIYVDYLSFGLPAKPEGADQEENAQETDSEQLDEFIALQEAYDSAVGSMTDKAVGLREPLAAAETSNAFAEVATANGAVYGSTGYFSPNEPNAAPGWSFDILRELFTAEPGYVTDPFESGNKIYVAKLSDKRDTFIPPYEEVKDKVKDAVLRQNAKVRADEAAAELAKDLNASESTMSVADFTRKAQAKGFEISQTPSFNRGQYLPRIGISSDFQDAAFSLSKDNPVSDAVSTSIGSAVIYLEEYTPASREEFENEKDVLMEKMITEKENEAVTEYLSRLRIEAKLDDNIARLRQQSQPQP